MVTLSRLHLSFVGTCVDRNFNIFMPTLGTQKFGGGRRVFSVLFCSLSVFLSARLFCQQHRAGSQESPRNRMKPISGKEFHGNEKEKTLMSCWSGCSVHFSVKNIALTFSLDCAVFVSADVLLNVYVVSDIQNEQFKSQVIEKYFLSITPYSQSPPPPPIINFLSHMGDQLNTTRQKIT